MTLFSLLESLFFMSLALSFFLIFLMVYHFKTRMDSLDRKNETLGDICKTLIKEIESAKNNSSSIQHQKQMFESFESFEDQNPLEELIKQIKEAQRAGPLDMKQYDNEVLVDILDDDDDDDDGSTRVEELADDCVSLEDCLVDAVIDEVVDESLEVIEVTDPEVIDHEVTDPEVTDSEVTDHEVADPEVTDPEVIDPEVTDSEVTDPEVNEVIDPEVTDPEMGVLGGLRPPASLKKMSVQMLRELAIEEGLSIESSSKMKKKDLITMFLVEKDV